MKIINDNVFERFVDLIDYDMFSINKDLMKQPKIKTILDKYILLTYYSTYFRDETKINIYYNRVFYYSLLIQKYREVFGVDDLNLEQEQLKLLEEGGQYEDINWSIIEDILHKENEYR